MTTPLWGNMREEPEWTAAAWTQLQTRLLAFGNDWDVWLRWYGDRRDGRPSLGEAFDIAVATLPNKLWSEGPAAVNARIKQLIAEHTPPEPIPAQGAGPHFALNTACKIDDAPPGEIDAQGNNVDRIRQLLPLLRQAVADLAGHLNPNIHPELARNVAAYRAALGAEGEAVPWGTLFGLGVRLENAGAAAQREIDRLQQPLEDATQEALNSVLDLHGPLILSTGEGRALSELADEYRQTANQKTALREDALAVAAALKNSPEIIEPRVAERAEGAAETVEEGEHPERGAAYWLATLKNISTIAVPAGVLGAWAWWVGGAAENAVLLAGAALVHHNERIRDAAKALGADYHRLVDVALDTAKDQTELAKAQAIARLRLLTPFRDFITANEKPLRRIASYSTNLRWMIRYIDLIARTNPPRH
jgi:hypothetical protein